MERRNFLKVALGIGCMAAAGGGFRATESEAAPLLPSGLTDKGHSSRDGGAQHAVTSPEEAERIAPDQVRWGHHGHGHGHGHGHWHHGHAHHWGWHRRHWGWRHHHRHWHRHWHR